MCRWLQATLHVQFCKTYWIKKSIHFSQIWYLIWRPYCRVWCLIASTQNVDGVFSKAGATEAHGYCSMKCNTEEEMCSVTSLATTEKIPRCILIHLKHLTASRFKMMTVSPQLALIPLRMTQLLAACCFLLQC